MSFTDLSALWTMFHNPGVLEYQRKAFRGIVKELTDSFSTDELKLDGGAYFGYQVPRISGHCGREPEINFGNAPVCICEHRQWRNTIFETEIRTVHTAPILKRRVSNHELVCQNAKRPIINLFVMFLSFDHFRRKIAVRLFPGACTLIRNRRF
jgi:hypothetical protein